MRQCPWAQVMANGDVGLFFPLPPVPCTSHGHALKHVDPTFWVIYFQAAFNICNFCLIH